MGPGRSRLLLLFRSQFQYYLPGSSPDISNPVLRLLFIMWSGFIIYIGFMCMLSDSSHVQLFATLLDSSPPGSSVHGVLEARILESVAMPSLYQGIIWTHGWNLNLLHPRHWQSGSLPWAPPEKPLPLFDSILFFHFCLLIITQPNWNLSSKRAIFGLCLMYVWGQAQYSVHTGWSDICWMKYYNIT